MSALNEQKTSTGFGDANDNRKRKADDSETKMDTERPYLAPIAASAVSSSKKTAKDTRRGIFLIFVLKIFFEKTFFGKLARKLFS